MEFDDVQFDNGLSLECVFYFFLYLQYCQVVFVFDVYVQVELIVCLFELQGRVVVGQGNVVNFVVQNYDGVGYFSCDIGIEQCVVDVGCCFVQGVVYEFLLECFVVVCNGLIFGQECFYFGSGGWMVQVYDVFDQFVMDGVYDGY